VVKFDRRRFDVTLFTFNGPVDDRSTYVHGCAHHHWGRPCSITLAFTHSACRHRGRTVVLPYKMADARQMIADAVMDVLFYTDIGLDTLTYFLSFARLAPVQMMTWGHPITTGHRHMDYFVSSEVLEPAEGDDEYTEAVVRLPHLPVYFAVPPDQLPLDRPRSEFFGLGLDAADETGRVCHR
jgi:hypothetical protein